MFLGGLVDKAKGFAEKRPGMAKAIGLGGGMLLNKAIGNKGAGLFSKMSGAGLMGMLGEHLRQRRNANQNIEVPQAEYGAMVKKYRTGGMIYAEDSDLLQTEKDKNGTSGNGGELRTPEGKKMRKVGDLLRTLEAIETPEVYPEDIAEDFVAVRGADDRREERVAAIEGRGIGRSLDDPRLAQPMNFEVDGERFTLEGVELGGYDEEKGIMNPNVITLPAEIYDMMEEGDISEADLGQVLSVYYGRQGDQRGSSSKITTRPKFIRGEDPEGDDDDFRKGRPPRNRNRKINLNWPEFNFPKPEPRSVTRYSRGSNAPNKMRPLFTPGQHRRIGRGS